MQSLSAPTGSQRIVKIDGQEVVLRGVSFEVIGLLQAEAVRQKRKDKIDTASLLREHLSPEEFRDEMRRAATEAEAIILTEQLFMEFLHGSRGGEESGVTLNAASTMVWAMIETQNPKRFTRDQVMRSIMSGELAQDDVVWALSTLNGNSDAGAEPGNSVAPPGKRKRS